MRHLPVTKFFPSGKKRTYTSLRAFTEECPARSALTGNRCVLTNIRKLKNGGGLATVKSFEMEPGIYHRRARPTGTWRLHFASHTLLKKFLKSRAATYGKASGSLDGARRRRRKRR